MCQIASQPHLVCRTPHRHAGLVRLFDPHGSQIAVGTGIAHAHPDPQSTSSQLERHRCGRPTGACSDAVVLAPLAAKTVIFENSRAQTAQNRQVTVLCCRVTAERSGTPPGPAHAAPASPRWRGGRLERAATLRCSTNRRQACAHVCSPEIPVSHGRRWLCAGPG